MESLSITDNNNYFYNFFSLNKIILYLLTYWILYTKPFIDAKIYEDEFKVQDVIHLLDLLGDEMINRVINLIIIIIINETPKQYVWLKPTRDFEM